MNAGQFRDMPQRDIDQLPDQVSAKEVRRILLPYMDKQEAIQALQSHRQLEQAEENEEPQDLSPAEQQELIQELETEYEATQAAVQSLDIDLTSPDYEEIEHEHLNEFTDRDKFKQAMVDIPDNPILQQMLGGEIPEQDEVEGSATESLPDWISEEGIQFDDVPEEDLQDYEIVSFPISHLVAMQRTVTTDAYEDLPTEDDEFEELLEYCLPTEGQSITFGNEISTEGGEFNGYQVISRDPNLGSAMQIKNTPNGHEIIFQIGGSPNFVQIKQYKGRYILKNGYHRVVKLYEAGRTHVPAVLSDAESWEDVTQNADHFGPQVVLQDRPPLVTDFLADWAKSIKRPATNKVIRVMQETTSFPR